MSELTLTLLRLGLLVALWLFVFGVLSTLRRDLIADGRNAGRRTTQRQQLQHQPRHIRSRRGAHIVVTRFDGSSQRIQLEDEVISFGTDADNTIIVDDDFTSPHHARIVPREHGWVIEDLGSTNGTWVERKRITSLTPLASGMHVRIGRTEIVVGS